MSYLKTIRHAERYLGLSKSPPFFESWYYKIVDAAGENPFAVIPAIFKSEAPEESYACIQIIDGLNSKTAFNKYLMEGLKAEERRFALNIGSNHFSETRLALNIKSRDFGINGTLVLGEMTPWPISLFSPNMNGLAGFLPNRRFNRKILSLNHDLIGHLNFNGRKIDFSGGKGFIEKNWGQTSPTGRLWFQSNHFSAYGTSLVGSLFVETNTNQETSRFSVGLRHKGFLHRFASHSRARTEAISLTEDSVEWVISSGKKTLEISADRQNEAIVFGGTEEGFTNRSKQTMLSEIRVTLKENQTTILKDSGRFAAIELFGPIDRLIETQQSS